MSIQDQIQLDVNMISANSHLQTQLFDFLKLLKANMPLSHNLDKVLSHAGTLDNDSAEEITKIVNEDFGKIDSEWH